MMKKLLLFLFLFLYTAVADEKKNIFILHSYSQEYSWTKLQHEGFIAKLNQLNLISNIATEHLDTKRVPFLKHYQEQFLLYLQEKYSNYHPDVIYCSDDNALEFLRTFKSQLFPDTPVVFSGVNNLALQIELDLTHFTGVFELKEVKPNIELIRQFSPQTRDLFFVGDSSNTYKAIEHLIKKEMPNFPKYNFHFFASNTIDSVILSIKNQLHPKPFIILTTIGGFTDEAGNNLALQSSIKAFSEIENSVLITMEDAYMQPGVIGGYVTYGTKQGALAAQMVQQIFNKISVEKIKPIVKDANIYMFDKKELQKSRLILSEYIGRNAIIKNEKLPFFEQYQHFLLNALFLISIFLIFFLVFFYFVFKERSLAYKELQLEFDEHNKKLENSSISIDMFEHIFTFGYWYKDMVTDEFFFSNGLLALCAKNDKAIFETLDDLMQSVNAMDKKLVENNIHHAIKSMHPIEFYHQIHSDDNRDIKVFHKIDFHRDAAFNIKKVVGIIRQIDSANI